ncbi:MAG: glycosyltransferase family 39 protein [Anaerolineae bacterium]|nr:glycosyltransferase family 39 protein [Anaerolineae bacterium]
MSEIQSPNPSHASRITPHGLRITDYRLPNTDHRFPLEKVIIIGLTLVAFAARVWQLADFPPGWRDDELINSLVISQKVLDGDWQLFYPDASGNEALYFGLNAPLLALFGANFVGMRLLSVFWGVTAVPLTWLLGRKLFSSSVGLLAAAGLSLSFWSLMYSRFALRQIVTPTLLLLAFYFFWRALTRVRSQVSGVKLPKSHHASRLTPHASRITDYRLRITAYALAGFWLALGFYVYFAGRGVPLILLAFCGYMVVVAWPLLRREWRGIVFMFVVTAVLVIPLFITIQRQPEAEARVGELAGPLIAARAGDFSLIQKHVVATLSMFHADGDDEWLYNIPHRPVFGLLGALFIWLGVFIALFYTLKPLPERARQAVTKFRVWRRGAPPTSPVQVTYHASRITDDASRITDDASRITDDGLRITDDGLRITDYRLPAAFLLIWWLVGLSPGFVSVPPASLGHTIIALPVTYMLMALPIWQFQRLMVNGQWSMVNRKMVGVLGVVLGILLVATIAIRDLPDYFETWPQRGMVRFLYRADLHELAAYLNGQPDSIVADFSIASLLDGPWDKVALQIDLDEDVPVSARWYHPERALFLQPVLSLHWSPNVPSPYTGWMEPADGQTSIAHFTPVQPALALPENTPVCFANGLCSVHAVYDPASGILELGWQVARPLDLPSFTLISNPPPPGVYAGPRLLAFGQLLAADGSFITGDDGFWVDPYTLQPGDLFVQQHRLTLPPDAQPATAAFGLYDPMTGERIWTDDGRDHITLEIGD